MSLLTPDAGLLFWMIFSFGIVFIILAKYGFPVITKALEERRAFIDESMESARKANEQLVNISAEGEAIIRKANEEHSCILNEAMEIKQHILEDARKQAEAETRLCIEKATQEIERAKKKAVRDIRDEIAGISVRIAEKIIRENLKSDTKQKEFINRLIDEEVIYKS